MTVARSADAPRQDSVDVMKCVFEDFRDKFHENQGKLWCHIDKCMGRQDSQMMQLSQRLANVERLLQKALGIESDVPSHSDSTDCVGGSTRPHPFPCLLHAKSSVNTSGKSMEADVTPKCKRSSSSSVSPTDAVNARVTANRHASTKTQSTLQSYLDQEEEDSDDSAPSNSPQQRQRKFNTKERILLDARTHWRRMIRKKRCHASTQSQDDLVMRKSQESLLQSSSFMWRCVQSRNYEYAVMCMVILNTAFIGWQVQHQALHREVDEIQDVGDATFCIIFSCELLIRFATLRSHLFRATERWWNLFDTAVVSMMLFEQSLKLFVQQGNSMLSQMSVVRVLRVVRIVRVVRVIRVLKFFRELRMMIASIMSSLKSLTWAMLVLVMMFYVFGISLTQGAIDYCAQYDAWSSASTDLLRSHFGTLDRAILSLFEAMSGGISWGELVIALQPLHFTYTLLFLVFISFSIFAVVNIVTGIFVDTAMQSSHDKEALIQDEMIAKQGYMQTMQRVFEEMDTDHSGTVTLEEFKIAITDERMVAYFNALGLDITDVGTLFFLLDRDRLGHIDIEEFLLGILRLRGGARSLDLAKLLYESEYMVHSMEMLSDAVKDLSRQITKPESWMQEESVKPVLTAPSLQL